MKVFGGACAALLSATVLLHSASRQATSRIWIADATIISPEHLDNVAVGSVLIEDGHIARVVRGAVRAPTDAQVVSARGQFLIPGLIDSHVHVGGIPGVDENTDHKPQPSVIRQYFEQLPRSYLYFGYTTVIDLAVMNRSVIDDFRHAPLHPDLYDCGPSLPVANGYPMSFLSSEQRFLRFPNWLLDPLHASDLPAGYDATEHTPEAAVATVKNSGGICVKTYFERGFGRDRNLPVITPEMIARVRQAAHANGLVLIMHANSYEAQRFAVNSSVDVIAHGMWNWGDFNGRQDLPPEIRSVLDQIVEKNIGVQSTMQVMQGGFRAYFDPEYLRMSAVPEVIPATLLAWFNTSEGKWFRQEITEGRDVSDSTVREGLERGAIRRGRQVVAYLAGKHARFLFGTDTPSAPSYGNLPGLNEYLEMQDLAAAGVPLRQVLAAATIDNARMFHLDSQVGTIEPGKVANLLLLKSSPLATVDAYNSIATVFLHGQATIREGLAARSNR